MKIFRKSHVGSRSTKRAHADERELYHNHKYKYTSDEHTIKFNDYQRGMKFSDKRNEKNFSDDSKKYRFGNFSAYYGYRNPHGQDSRLDCMRRELFESKDVLDIGCNAGHFTLTIARRFRPRKIIGIDIDAELIKIARKNVRHYLTPSETSTCFPISLVVSYGPAIIPEKEMPTPKFPFNVFFVQGNYILESDQLLEMQTPQFDTILCLSLTKWIHLNWGDEGIKKLFHRIFKQLRPGGHLILECQSWESYSRKKKITEATYKNYNNIKLFPEQFNEYLLNEVGFKTCELLDIPAHHSKGFCRPIYLLTKESVASENANKTNFEDIEHSVLHKDNSDEIQWDPDELSD